MTGERLLKTVEEAEKHNLAGDSSEARIVPLRVVTDLTMLCRRIANIGRLGRGDTDDKRVIAKMVELAQGGVRIGTEHGVVFSILRESEA